MAYTTEEQDFQSFMEKVRQYLPLILTVIAVAVATYSAITWYKQHQETKTNDLYVEYKTINATGDKALAMDTRADLSEKYFKENPDKALSVIGLLRLSNDYVRAGKFQQAYDAIAQIPEDNSFNNEMVAIAKAKILFQLGQVPEAVKFLDTIKEGDWYITAKSLAGDFFYSAIKYDQSLAEYEKAKTYISNQLAKTDLSAEDKETFNTFLRYVQSRINIVQSLNKNLVNGTATSAAPAETASAQEAPASEEGK